MQEEYYTVEEISNILKVHPNTVRKSIKKGRITAFRAGSGKRSPLRIAKSELERIKVMDFEVTLKNLLTYKLEHKVV
jgi:DNA binding domain, excisionase family